MKTQRIGFIGLGSMGSKIAGRLMAAGGYVPVVYNRTAEKAAAIVGRGAKLAKSPKELAACSDVVFTVLSNDKAVRDVMEGETGAFAGAAPGTIFVDCGTSSVQATRDLAQQAERMGFHWIDAPVLGSPQSAEAGEMAFVAGGDPKILEQIEGILKVVGPKIVWMGGSGMGQAAKLVHNLVCGISLVAFSEALVLGEKLGLTRKQVLEVLLNGAVSSTLLKIKAAKFESNQFEPTTATLINMSKDLILAQDAAEALNLQLPVLFSAKKLYDAAMECGLGRQDTSSVIKALK